MLELKNIQVAIRKNILLNQISAYFESGKIVCKALANTTKAHNPPPEFIPKTPGEAKGFLKSACITAPATAKEAPVESKTMRRGIRSSSRGFQSILFPIKRSDAPKQTVFQSVVP